MKELMECHMLSNKTVIISLLGGAPASPDCPDWGGYSPQTFTLNYSKCILHNKIIQNEHDFLHKRLLVLPET